MILIKYSPLLLVLFLIPGCATRAGKLDNGREYLEYDVIFDRDSSSFHVPLKWIDEQEYEYSYSNTLQKNNTGENKNE
jgi:hypothetical protein